MTNPLERLVRSDLVYIDGYPNWWGYVIEQEEDIVAVSVLGIKREPFHFKRLTRVKTEQSSIRDSWTKGA